MAARRQGKWIRRSRQEWRGLLAKFDDSGLGVEAFCRREAVSAASFYRWRGRLGDADDGGEVAGGDPAPAFVDLGTLDRGASSKPRIELKLELGDGLVLHLVRH